MNTLLRHGGSAVIPLLTGTRTSFVPIRLRPDVRSNVAAADLAATVN